MTFDDWFLEFSSWGLSHEQLVTASFTAPGSDPGDEVYTSPAGNVMTRHICSHWINFYGASKAGWDAALTNKATKWEVLAAKAVARANAWKQMIALGPALTGIARTQRRETALPPW